MRVGWRIQRWLGQISHRFRYRLPTPEFKQIARKPGVEFGMGLDGPYLCPVLQHRNGAKGRTGHHLGVRRQLDNLILVESLHRYLSRFTWKPKAGFDVVGMHPDPPALRRQLDAATKGLRYQLVTKTNPNQLARMTQIPGSLTSRQIGSR